MRHGNRRTFIAAPSLIRESERRSRAGNGIHIERLHIPLVSRFGRSTPLAHRTAVKSPILLPSRLDLRHKERIHCYRMLRRFIGFVERFLFRTTHCEISAGDSHHFKGDRSTGYLLYKIGKRSDLSRFLKKPACVCCATAGCAQARNTRHARMRVIRIMVSCIQMATNALKIHLCVILIVIHMCRNTFVGNTLRKKILMTLHTRSIRDVFHRMFQFRFLIPVEIGAVFCKIPPHIANAQLQFSRIMLPGIIGRRKVAIHAIHHYPASVVYMHR